MARSEPGEAGVPGGFEVAGGPLQGRYDAVLLMTDLESDDAVAIKALAPSLRGVPMLVVVGEGNADKRNLAAAVLRTYGLQAGTTIVQGRRSAVPYPSSALESYDSGSAAAMLKASSLVAAAATIEHTETAERCIAEFLQRHSAPLALLLKPPHELLSLDGTARASCPRAALKCCLSQQPPGVGLGHVSAALYGSFNLTVLRSAMKEAVPTMSDDEQLARQEGLLHSFRVCVLVERSTSVGRDAVIDPDGACGKLWPWIEADEPLMTLIEAWNANTVCNQSRAISSIAQQIVSACRESPHRAFDLVQDKAAGMDKKLAILSSIAQCRGKQVCLADPLLVAVLFDDQSRFSPYLEQAVARFGPYDKGKVFSLTASTGKRQELLALVADVLHGAVVVHDGREPYEA